jgi:hypothetical protein
VLSNRQIIAIALAMLCVTGFNVTPARADPGSQADSALLAGYSKSTSVLPGGVIELAVRSSSTWTGSIYRIGNYAGGQKLVSEISQQPSTSQPDCTLSTDGARTITCPWATSISFKTTGYQPGLYVAQLNSSAGYNLAPFVVRTPKPQGTSLVKVGMLSLQAYNQFGAYNAYLGGGAESSLKSRIVSFDRPLDAWGISNLRTYDMSIAQSVDAVLPNASWTTDIDVSTGATSLKGVRQLITSGHDEYWTTAERNKVEAALKKKMNLFVTGANSIFWRVRLMDSNVGANRKMAIYKVAALDPLANKGQPTVRWRQKPLSRSESQITGTQYNNWYDVCANEERDWVVSDPSWWGYSNTGVSSGSVIPGLVADEVDQLMSKFKIPKNTRVIASSVHTCSATGATVVKQHDATFITLKSGGSVFAVGTQKWSCALVSSCAGATRMTPQTYDFVSKVTSNVLTVFDAGPVKKSYKSVNNVKKIYPKTKFKYIDW